MPWASKFAGRHACHTQSDFHLAPAERSPVCAALQTSLPFNRCHELTGIKARFAEAQPHPTFAACHREGRVLG